jgi:rhamnose transport system ATP-binding protein
MAQPVLEIRNVSKRFDATQALSDVSLSLYEGEIHALLGENGAGKSTLIKIMTGIHQPDSGEMMLNGQTIKLANAAQAQRYGITTIYQEPMIYPDLNVAENIFVGHHDTGFLVNWRKRYQEAQAILDKLGVKIDARSQARGLSVASQQTVEIAKSLSLNAKVLILDEPTAALSAHEVRQLFNILNTLRAQGVAILFISHRMDEVFEIADRITIFRDGQWVSSEPRAKVTPEIAIRQMVGRELGEFFVKKDHALGKLLLEVKDLACENVFGGVNFTIRAGEIVGFAGLVGSKRTDVAHALFGITPATSGEIIFKGKPVKIESPQQATQLGIAYVPEDRRHQGLALPMSIANNITLPTMHKYINRWGIVNRRLENVTAEAYRQKLRIRTSDIHLQTAKLSGGNQQKVVLSKWLNTKPQLLILDEPTRGIDVGAKAEVHALVNDLAEQGLGILLISSDLPEVLAMSDRLVVMREGRQMALLNRHEATQETVMTVAMGQKERAS